MATKEDTGTVVKEREEIKYKKPKLHKIIFHNDDFTPFEFVVELLRTIYKKAEGEARELAANIHKTGTGIAYVHTAEICETKIMQTTVLVKQADHPLQVTMEPE